MEAAAATLEQMSFRQALILFPLAVALHIFEEWPRFPRWARRFASPTYTDRDYIITHVFAILFAIGAVLLVRAFPNRWILFGFFAFVFWPGTFCNALFHAGATVLSRRYCPGVLTGILVYLPLSFLLAVVGVRDGLLSERSLLVALIVAGGFHTIEVGHNVFKRWWAPSPPRAPSQAVPVEAGIARSMPSVQR